MSRKVETPEISSQDIEAFERDGVICLRGMFEDVWLARMGVAIDRDIANPGPLSDDVIKGGRFLNDNFMWTRDVDFRAFVFESPAAAIALQVLKSEKVNLLNDNLLVKEPGAAIDVPWHNDKPYWPVQGWKGCTIWLALDTVTKNSGAIKYIKGSHKWRKHLLATDVAEGLVDREHQEFLSWDLEPGDCLVHHWLTIHSSPGNISSRRRRGLATVWVGDDITYDFLPDTWFMKSIDKLDIPEADSINSLKVGEPIDCDLFPRGYLSRKY
ncbi:MAG: phytanoyl-CoA dioxygenase family protein [Xenococcaceae cyanobacterium]